MHEFVGNDVTVGGPRAWRRLVGNDAMVLLAIALLVRAVGFWVTVFDPDESVFELAAREVLRGHLPYQTFFDIKPIGSSLLLGLAFKLFGAGTLTMRLVGLGCVWLSSLLLARLARGFGMPRGAAVMAGALYIVFSATVDGLATMTEILYAPFTIAGVLLLLRQLTPAASGRRIGLAIAAGVCCGLAILIKLVPALPGGLMAAAVFGLLLHRGTVGWGQAVLLASLFGAAAALPMLIGAAVYAQAGALPMFLYSNFGFAARYTAAAPDFAGTFKHLSFAGVALFPLIGLAGWGVVAARAEGPARRRAAALLLVWLAGEVLAASATRQFFVHYFLGCVPPLALLGALATGRLRDWIGGQRRRAGMVAGVLLSTLAMTYANIPLLSPPFSNPETVAAHMAATDRRWPPTLYVLSGISIELYNVTGADLPTRFAIPSQLLPQHGSLAQVDPRVELARILNTTPDFIAIDANEPETEATTRLLTDTLRRRYCRAFVEDDWLLIFQSRASRGQPLPVPVPARTPPCR